MHEAWHVGQQGSISPLPAVSSAHLIADNREENCFFLLLIRAGAQRKREQSTDVGRKRKDLGEIVVEESK